MNFYDACKEGNLELVKKYIKEGQDPSSEEDYAIRWASRHGHTEAVKLLSRDIRVISSLKTELKKYISEEEYNAIISENEEFFI